MKLSIMVAMGRNRVIGKNNALPWRLPADLRHFREITMGHPIVMGRKTYESIGKGLPGRTNIVLTRQKDYEAAGCLVADTVAKAMSLAREADEIFIIGGGSVYHRTLDLADRLYVTLIDHEFDGEVFFPEIHSVYTKPVRIAFEIGTDRTIAKAPRSRLLFTQLSLLQQVAASAFSSRNYC